MPQKVEEGEEEQEEVLMVGVGVEQMLQQTKKADLEEEAEATVVAVEAPLVQEALPPPEEVEVLEAVEGELRFQKVEEAVEAMEEQS